MGIAEFLLARIAVAEEVVRQYREVWDEDESDPFHPYLIEKEDPFLCIDPAFVLAECAARRRIVELHESSHECSGYDHNGEFDNCMWIIDGDECSTLRLLAAPYAAHPDYRPEWSVTVPA